MLMLLFCEYTKMASNLWNKDEENVNNSSHDNLSYQDATTNNELYQLIDELNFNDTNLDDFGQEPFIDLFKYISDDAQPINTNLRHYFYDDSAEQKDFSFCEINLKYSCYQSYYLNVLKIHFKYYKFINSNIFNNILCTEMKLNIEKLLFLRHEIQLKVLRSQINFSKNDSLAFFLPKSHFMELNNFIEDNYKIKYYNYDLIFELTKYVREIKFACETEAIYKIIFDFMLREFFITLEMDSYVNLPKNIDFSSKSNIEQDEFLFLTYISAYLHLKKTKTDPKTLFNSVKFHFSPQFYNENWTRCPICYNKLSKCILLFKGNSFFCVFCHNHHNTTKITRIFSSSTTPLPKIDTVLIYLNKILLNFQKNYAKHSSKLGPEIKRSSSIVYYKKMIDFIRYLINNKSKRDKIMGLFDLIISNLPCNNYNISLVLQKILQYELKSDKDYSNITGCFATVYIDSEDGNSQMTNELYENSMNSFESLKSEMLQLYDSSQILNTILSEENII